MYKIIPISNNYINIDIDLIKSWFNNPVLNKYTSHKNKYMEYMDVVEYINKLDKCTDIKLWFIFNPYQHIGNISLQQIDYVNRSAEIAWMISEQGKRAGTEAGRQVIDYAFNVLNLNRVWCGCVKENIGMVKVAEKLGMKQEGISREAFFLDGRYTDIINFGILKEEWNEHKS